MIQLLIAHVIAYFASAPFFAMMSPLTRTLIRYVYAYAILLFADYDAFRLIISRCWRCHVIIDDYLIHCRFFFHAALRYFAMLCYFALYADLLRHALLRVPRLCFVDYDACFAMPFDIIFRFDMLRHMLFRLFRCLYYC